MVQGCCLLEERQPQDDGGKVEMHLVGLRWWLLRVESGLIKFMPKLTVFTSRMLQCRKKKNNIVFLWANLV